MESLLVYLGDGDTIKENAALLSGKECWFLSGLQVIGAVFGALLEEERAFLYGAGAQTLIEITENETSYWKADTRAKILTDLLKQNKGTLLFLGDTIQEREIGARVCAAMGWPGWNHIVSVESEGERKRIRRLAYGKCLLEEISLRQPSVMSFLLRPRQLANGTGGELVSYSADHIRPFGQAECVEEIREPVEDIDLEKAEIVIGGGNGLGGRENFELLRELAIRLGGAVAATRPVIEAGWAPRNRQVGQSGKSISPELYLAFGISGASQHISGMINAKYVVAVNTDAEAPIFQYADYGIVGDVNEILPKLLQDLK